MIGIIFDPSFLFCLGCLLTPLAIQYRENPELIYNETLKHFSDPAIIIGFSFIILALFLCRNSKSSLGILESKIANWMLFNGGIIHVTMDGLTGGYHLLPLLNKHYCILDKRFLTDEPNSFVITQIELFIMAPLCFLSYISFRNGSIHKYTFSIVVSSLQIMGGIIFAGSEIVANFPNVPVDRNFQFTFHYLLYFWFGFGANLIWILIPLLIILHSMKEIGKLELREQEKKNK